MCIGLTKNYLSYEIVETVPELCQKGDLLFLEKDERHFCLCSETMLTIISTLMCKSSKLRVSNYWLTACSSLPRKKCG